MNKKLKILYAIQGTGNGHITRAMEIVPLLKKKGTVDVLISGIQSDLELPFKVQYKLNGLSFIFGTKGGVDIWHTYARMNTLRLLKEIKSLDPTKYDLVISDFEPVSAWACQLAGVPCIGLSNQAATLHPKTPKPKNIDLIGKLVLEHYAPVTFNYGFHFKRLDKSIFTPIIRKEVRSLTPSDKGHYTVYLPSYSDERIIKVLDKMENITWEVFSKRCTKKFEHNKITIQPIKQESFLKSIAASSGVLCNAGFGVASEALFLGKKLLVIPMKTQYEQMCNAAMLKSMGVTVIKKLRKKNIGKIENWIAKGAVAPVDYKDETEQILDMIIKNHAGHTVEHFAETGTYSSIQ
ncbi:MAG TPA: glycosyltransferase family protein [Bacteroidia bacterium]|nr:glycosyltransferase family protein [Bacteroidia bacterium]